MLVYHLSLDSQLAPDATSYMRSFGRHIPPKILEAYSHILDSSLAYIIAQEPQNVPFLPQGRELQEFCLTCSRNADNAALAIFQAGADEQKDLRRKAQILSLDLPESFTRSPQIELVTDAIPSFGKSWNLAHRIYEWAHLSF